MDYKFKKRLTDKDGKPFNQYFDAIEGEFKVQDEVSTEKTLQKIYRNNSLPNEPKHLTSVRFVKGAPVTYVNWFHDGLFYGSHSWNVFTSPDGVNWTLKASIPNTYSVIAFVMVSDTNRLIIGCSGGEVFVSDEAGAVPATPTLTTGVLSDRFGQSKHGNFIAFNSYVLPQGISSGQKHEAFLSSDNGETFVKVFDSTSFASIPGFADTSNVHIHNIEYDPYSGRLYIWIGDLACRTMIYSDDWGKTWTMAFKQGAANNATQVIATKDGIALGADTYGGGVGYVHIDRTKRINPVITIDDYEGDFWQFAEADERFIATRKWVDRVNGIYLIPYIVEYDDLSERSAYLAYSKDGYTWQNIFKSPHKGHYSGFYTINYGNGKLVGTYKNLVDAGFQIFVADIDLIN